MTDEIRCVIGICSDCIHLFAKVINNNDDEELCYFKCLISDDNIEGFVRHCSHYYNNKYASLFLTDEFRSRMG